MHVGSTRGYYQAVNCDQKLSIGNRDMGVLRLGGGAAASGGATWITLTKRLFSTRRTMKNAIRMKSISTSGPELWEFVLLGSGPHCCSICPVVHNKMLKFEVKSNSRF